MSTSTRMTLAGSLGLLVALGLAAAPAKPKDSAALLAQPLVAGGRLLGEMAQHQATLIQQPTAAASAVALAAALLDRAANTDSRRDLRAARRVLNPWWEADTLPYEVALMRARIRRANQDLDLAHEDLSGLLQIDPSDARLWGERAGIQEEQGDYGGALRNCLPLIEAAPGFSASLCICAATRFGSQADNSYQSLAKALEVAPEDTPVVQRSQARRVLAEIDRDRGRYPAAEAHLRAAHALDGTDTRSLAALADLLLERDRADEVPVLLAGQEASPDLLLRRALAARALGSAEMPDLVRRLRARFAGARLAGDAGRMAAEARFALELLGDPAQALWLAQGAWELARSPAAARVLLAAARVTGETAPRELVRAWVDGARVTVPWLLSSLDGPQQ